MENGTLKLTYNGDTVVFTIKGNSADVKIIGQKLYNEALKLVIEKEDQAVAKGGILIDPKPSN